MKEWALGNGKDRIKPTLMIPDGQFVSNRTSLTVVYLELQASKAISAKQLCLVLNGKLNKIKVL